MLYVTGFLLAAVTIQVSAHLLLEQRNTQLESRQSACETIYGVYQDQSQACQANLTCPCESALPTLKTCLSCLVANGNNTQFLRQLIDEYNRGCNGSNMVFSISSKSLPATVPGVRLVTPSPTTQSAAISSSSSRSSSSSSSFSGISFSTYTPKVPSTTVVVVTFTIPAEDPPPSSVSTSGGTHVYIRHTTLYAIVAVLTAGVGFS